MKPSGIVFWNCKQPMEYNLQKIQVSLAIRNVPGKSTTANTKSAVLSLK